MTVSAAVVATALAAATTGLAAALATPRAVVGPVPGGGLRPRGPWPLPVGRSAAVLVVTTGLVVLLAPGARVVALAGLAAGAAVALRRAMLARAREADAADRSARVLEACDQLASELSAGRPPGAALTRAAADWPDLAPVAAAFEIGADVPAALRALADLPGGRDLHLVAAAWEVAHRTGQGLAVTVERVAEEVRAAQATRRVVRSELASARATARLVAALPVVTLLMGSGSGGDPWGFLLGHPVGLACLAAGLSLAWLGLAWIGAIARGVERGG